MEDQFRNQDPARRTIHSLTARVPSKFVGSVLKVAFEVLLTFQVCRLSEERGLPIGPSLIPAPLSHHQPFNVQRPNAMNCCVIIDLSGPPVSLISGWGGPYSPESQITTGYVHT